MGFKMKPGSKQMHSDDSFRMDSPMKRMSTPLMSNGDKKSARKVIKEAKKEERAEWNKEQDKTGKPFIGPGGTGVQSIQEIAHGAKRTFKAKAKAEGKSGKEARKAGRQAAKDTKKGIRAADKAAWEGAKAAKKAYKKNPSEENKRKLTAATKTKADHQRSSQARSARFLHM